MSKAIKATQASPTTPIISFAEVSCFNKQDQIRANLQPVVFRLFSVGRGLGSKLDVEFVSDYALYYDNDDSCLVTALSNAAPAYPWSTMMFHRWLDQSRIQVVNPDTGRIVAQIETRRYYGRKICDQSVVSGAYGSNLISLSAEKARRAVQPDNDG